MDEALGFLLFAALGGVMLRFAEAIVAALRRLNEATGRRLPKPISMPFLKPPEAAYGAMYLLCALGGMILVVTGLIGFVLSL